MTRIRVMVVDDQAVFRSAVSSMLVDDDSGFVVVREAEDSAEAMRGAVAAPLPDVALVDVQLGVDDGIELCRRLVEVRPDLDVVLVSTLSPDDLPADAETCGALGFISKSRLTPQTLIELCGRPRRIR